MATEPKKAGPEQLTATFRIGGSVLSVNDDNTAQYENDEIRNFEAWVDQLVAAREWVRARWASPRLKEVQR